MGRMKENVHSIDNAKCAMDRIIKNDQWLELIFKNQNMQWVEL